MPDGPPPRRTNPLAVVSLVTSLIGLFFLAVPLGIVALVQIGRRQEAGKGVAIAGVAVGAFVGLLVTLLVSLGLTGAFDSEPLGPTREAGATSVGTCLDDQGFGAWQVTDCDGGHTGEVYYVLELGAGPVPSEDEVRDVADTACDQQFTRYVGESSDFSDYDYAYFGPDAADWREDERRVVCVAIGAFDDLLYGSVQGRGR